MNNEIRFSSAAASVWPKILKEICARKNIRDVTSPVPGGLTPSRMSPMFILMEAF